MFSFSNQKKFEVLIESFYATYSELKGYRHQIDLVRLFITNCTAITIQYNQIGKKKSIAAYTAVGLLLSFRFMPVKPPQNYQLCVKILRFKNQEFLVR